MEDGMSGFYYPTLPPSHPAFLRHPNHHHASGGATGTGAGTGTKCGRWNPTAEQVKVLTELFKSGLRTPSTDQIQKISSQLSFYGKIESKNVFYWFQNHKARERQKRRRVSKPVVIGDDDETRLPRLIVDDHKSVTPTAKCFGEINQVPTYDQQERTIETLQLFPLNSYNDPDSDKLRFFSNECKENAAFHYTIGREIDHPPLDLCLSFF